MSQCFVIKAKQSGGKPPLNESYRRVVAYSSILFFMLLEYLSFFHKAEIVFVFLVSLLLQIRLPPFDCKTKV